MSFLLLTGLMPPRRDAALPLALTWQPSSSSADTITANNSSTITLEALWILAAEMWRMPGWCSMTVLVHHRQQAEAEARERLMLC